MSKEFEDKLVVEGINSQGYGIMPKMIMQDKRLTIESKAIYAYLVSYAGAGSSAFPGLKRILNDLCISENRFYRHRKLLIDCGYISVNAIRNEKKVIIKNIYTLHSNPEKLGSNSKKVVSSILEDRVSHKTEDRGIPQNDGGGIVTDYKINKLKLTSSFKEKDDDEKNNIKHSEKNEIDELVKLTDDNQELKYLSQGLFESNVEIKEIVEIMKYFKDTGNFKMDVVQQQLEWMKQKSQSEIGISEFSTYFINGYAERIKSSKIKPSNELSETFYDKMGITEELPPVPMHNWLNKNI